MRTPTRRPNLQTPFKGEPQTSLIPQPDGSLAYRIRSQHLTPLRAKIADWLNTGTFLFFMGGSGYGAITAFPDEPKVWLVTVATVFAAHWPVGWIHRQTLRTKATVELTADMLKIRRFLRWTCYDRTLPHSFTLLEHDKAQRERDRHDFAMRNAQRTGRLSEPRKYYQESRHVVFETVGQRIDIATIYGPTQARALQARLSGCAAMIDGERGTGEGIAPTPEHEWRRQPGDIPA